MKQESNRRPYPRRTSYIVAEYHVKEGVYRDIIRNIGASGIFIRTNRIIAEGQTIDLKFPLFEFEHQINITGKVVRSSPKGIAVTFDQPISGLICKEGEFPDIVHEINRDKDRSD